MVGIVTVNVQFALRLRAIWIININKNVSLPLFSRQVIKQNKFMQTNVAVLNGSFYFQL
jgi:hypothetical protein